MRRRKFRFFFSHAPLLLVAAAVFLFLHRRQHQQLPEGGGLRQRVRRGRETGGEPAAVRRWHAPNLFQQRWRLRSRGAVSGCWVEPFALVFAGTGGITPLLPRRQLQGETLRRVHAEGHRFPQQLRRSSTTPGTARHEPPRDRPARLRGNFPAHRHQEVARVRVRLLPVQPPRLLVVPAANQKRAVFVPEEGIVETPRGRVVREPATGEDSGCFIERLERNVAASAHLAVNPRVGVVTTALHRGRSRDRSFFVVVEDDGESAAAEKLVAGRICAGEFWRQRHLRPAPILHIAYWLLSFVPRRPYCSHVSLFDILTAFCGREQAIRSRGVPPRRQPTRTSISLLDHG
mmetsp:Transcript_20896/g.52808  ORF Transcript_20896/g.52808 Transcript_20896/m.52808 type:complete len:346 (+) Transcript_20896:650-1687(+)